MWYHYDRLGNVMDLTDENGNLSASYDHDAFGNVLSGSASGYHLTTKEFTPNIGLYYFYMRWYDPKLGRFISPEPLLSALRGQKLLSFGLKILSINQPTIGFQYEHISPPLLINSSIISGLLLLTIFDFIKYNPQIWNQYVYCGNNPFLYVDIDGKFWEWVGIVGGGVIGGIIGGWPGAAVGAAVGGVIGGFIEVWKDRRSKGVEKYNENVNKRNKDVDCVMKDPGWDI